MISNEPIAKFSSGRSRGESVKAYSAFTAYCRMGLDRSLAAVGRQLGKSTTLMEAWSSKYHWRERLEQWLAEQEAIQADADRQAALERAQLMKERRAMMEEQAFELHQKLTLRINSMLSWPLAKRTTQGAGVDDGATVVYEPARWSLSDVARLGQFRELMRRLSLGEAVSTQEMRAMELAAGGGRGGVSSVTITPGAGTGGVPSCIIEVVGIDQPDDEVIFLNNMVPLPPSQRTL